MTADNPENDKGIHPDLILLQAYILMKLRSLNVVAVSPNALMKAYNGRCGKTVKLEYPKTFNAAILRVKSCIHLLIGRNPNMSDPSSLVSNAFQTFMKEAPQHAQAWGGMVQSLAGASALDKKTSSLAYLAVLAVLRLESGIPFHVQAAKQFGASREEVISAILVGLPAAGHVVTQVLPAAIAVYDAS